jgi:hypothetical protein
MLRRWRFGAYGPSKRLYYSRLRNIGKNSPSRKNRIAPHQNFCGTMISVFYRIRLRIKANKSIVAIVEAVKVSKKIIYKLRLTLSI